MNPTALGGLFVAAFFVTGCSGQPVDGADSATEAAAAEASLRPDGTPEVLVHAPDGWKPSMSAWSVSATNSDFSFMDMTYGPPSGEFDDSTVYICVEVRGGSACPESDANVIDSYDVDGFRVSVAQTLRPDGDLDQATMQVWSGVRIDVGGS